MDKTRTPCGVSGQLIVIHSYPQAVGSYLLITFDLSTFVTKIQDFQGKISPWLSTLCIEVTYVTYVTKNYSVIRALNKYLKTASLSLNPRRQITYLVVQTTTFSDQLPHFTISVHNRCVVTTTELLTNFWKRKVS